MKFEFTQEQFYALLECAKIVESQEYHAANFQGDVEDIEDLCDQIAFQNYQHAKVALEALRS